MTGRTVRRRFPPSFPEIGSSPAAARPTSERSAGRSCRPNSQSTEPPENSGWFSDSTAEPLREPSLSAQLGSRAQTQSRASARIERTLPSPSRLLPRSHASHQPTRYARRDSCNRPSEVGRDFLDGGGPDPATAVREWSPTAATRWIMIHRQPDVLAVAIQAECPAQRRIR